MVNAIANFAVRGFQVIFAACITGLFVDLARGHKWDGTPITLGYTAFVGCVSLIAAFLGIAGEFIQFLQGYIGLALDGFIGLLNLAGGVVSPSFVPNRHQRENANTPYSSLLSSLTGSSAQMTTATRARLTTGKR